ncbi:MAG: DNA polymerase IV [Candidatus Cloacimonadales bacterium]
MEIKFLVKQEETRKIIHIDMDAYFAAIEQRDFPELRGKPVIVGGSVGERGVVSTCSYEARKFGIHSAMPATTAHKLCPQGIFVRPRFEAYKEATNKIFAIFRQYSDLVQPMSLDEAYIDVTTNKFGIPSATILAQEIRQRIKEELNLTASAGVSYNKFLAKIASDINKPDGICVITPKDALKVLASLPIKKFHGIGKSTAAHFEKFNIFTGADLIKRDLRWLIDNFGKVGYQYYYLVRGVDNREVCCDQVRKSIGKENTFRNDVDDLRVLFNHLQGIVTKLTAHISQEEIEVKTLTLKLRYENFDTLTRSKTLTAYTADFNVLLKESRRLLIDTYDTNRSVRLLGVSLTTLKHLNSNTWEQLIIDWKEEDERFEFLK